VCIWPAILNAAGIYVRHMAMTPIFMTVKSAGNTRSHHDDWANKLLAGLLHCCTVNHKTKAPYRYRPSETSQSTEIACVCTTLTAGSGLVNSKFQYTAVASIELTLHSPLDRMAIKHQPLEPPNTTICNICASQSTQPIQHTATLTGALPVPQNLRSTVRPSIKP
jgi:hypothetical protein